MDSAQQLIHAIHHSIARVCRKLHYPGVHSNRVFGASLDAVTAKNADAQIDVENFRGLFDIRIRVLQGDNMNAVRRTDGFAHHACDASRAPVASFGETVPRSKPACKGLSFLGILDGNGIPFADFQADSPGDMARKINDKVSGRNDQSTHYFREIETLENVQWTLSHDFIFK
jgi:hypothetical protein